MSFVVLEVEGEITALNLSKVDRVVHTLIDGKDSLDFYFSRTEKYTVKDITIDQIIHDLPIYKV
jgi:hypothetical protein